ncbi:MAG: malonyl-ACP O-methyltransferase BioC [Bacteroidales bacterium]
MTNKKLITQRFVKAAKAYGENATAQKLIAQNLISLLNKYKSFVEANHIETADCTKVLELGCGSGFLTRLLIEKVNPHTLIANDLSPFALSQLSLLSPNHHFIEGDAEKIDFGSHFDLIASASTVQWFHDLPAFLEKSSKALKSNGLLAISSFLPGNLKEIHALTGIGLDYFGLTELEEITSKYFDILDIREEEISLRFDHPLEVLKHLKNTGVTGISSFKWTKHKLSEFTNQYHREYCLGGKYLLTYKPVYMIAQKKHNTF